MRQMAILLTLVISGLAAAFFAIPPVYTVEVNGQRLPSSRHLAELTARVQAEVDGQLDRKVTLAAGEVEWTFALRSLGLSPVVDVPTAVAEAARLTPWWQRHIFGRPVLVLDHLTTWDVGITERTVEPVRTAVARDPVPATFAVVGKTPTITPEINGVTLRAQALVDALAALPPNASRLELPLSPLPPDVTRASLEAMGIKRLVAQWTTQYDPTIPRAENVERAARAFNGLVLKPGEILSYNATVGPVDAQNGWKEAFVIVNGELVPGVGGGVCQVATTFYGAALRANLEILERHQHQLAVSYIDPSQDAAIAQGYEDLKIRNTTDHYIYVEAEAGGGRVSFRLYGDVPAEQEVQIESHVLGSRPFPVKEISDGGLGPGARVVKAAGNPGLISEAYRLVYVKGVLVKRELLSRDNYLPTAQVVLVGR